MATAHRSAVVLAALALAPPVAAAKPAGATATSPTAQASRTINVTESARLHLVKRSGSTLWHRGTATGTLSGSVRGRFHISLFKVTGSVTVSTRGGSITFIVDGRPRSPAVRAPVSGAIRVIGGTGRYAGARGSGAFNGVVNRRSWDATVNLSGRLSY